MNDTFMKERPVFPLILSMALPMVISMLVNSLYNIVDSFFVAKISEDAMTALSLVFPVQNFANAIAIGFGIGISSLIAICLGAGNRETAGVEIHWRFSFAQMSDSHRRVDSNSSGADCRLRRKQGGEAGAALRFFKAPPRGCRKIGKRNS